MNNKVGYVIMVICAVRGLSATAVNDIENCECLFLSQADIGIQEGVRMAVLSL